MNSLTRLWPIARCLRALHARRRRNRARRELWSLDAYMLRDIGLSHRAAAEFAHSVDSVDGALS
jgi:uncharacterized protein YjiS (DUF1127 family)